MEEKITIKENEIKLADVHRIFSKWLFINDPLIIDLLLATYLSNQKEGTPVWLFIVAQSGDMKSELMRPFFRLHNVIVIDNMTTNSLISGHEEAQDLFSQIIGRNIMLIIPDVAVLSSKSPNEKNEIWAQFRNLYDGLLSKRTGMISKYSTDLHVTLIGGATPNFRSQYIINNQLGSRELLYTPNDRSEYLQKKLDKAMENDNYEQEMRKELMGAVMDFLCNKKLRTIDIGINNNRELNEFLNQQVKKLSILRATAHIDYYSSSIIGEINKETPTRAKKQLKRIIEALLSLDKNYDISNVKKIIERIVQSSGNQLRMQIMNEYEKGGKGIYRISELSEITRANKKMVRIELNYLWQLGWLEKKVTTEDVCGRMKSVPHYIRINEGKK